MEILINKKFAFLTVLAALGRLQNTMTVVALIAAGSAAGFAPLESSLIGAALFLAAALSATLKGKALDRLGYELVSRQALLLLLLFAATLLAFLYLPWWGALGAAFCLGLMRLNPGVLQNSLWSRYHKEEKQLQKALAMENLAGFLAQTVGPLLAAGAIWLGGGTLALVLTALLACGSMFLWGQIAPSIEETKRQTRETSLRLLPRLAPLVVGLFLCSLFVGMNQGILLQAGGGALYIALFTVGAGTASAYFLRRGLPFAGSRKTILLIAPIFFFFAMLFFESWALMPVLVLSGALFSAACLSANSQIKEIVPASRLNESFSLVLVGNTIGMSLGIFLSGALLDLLPENWRYVGALLALGAVLVNTALAHRLSPQLVAEKA